jgi:hypothetical protein
MGCSDRLAGVRFLLGDSVLTQMSGGADLYQSMGENSIFMDRSLPQISNGIVDVVARERIGRLFRFVAAMYERRNPSIRQMSEHDWMLRFSDVPDHHAIKIIRSVNTPDSESESSGSAVESETELIPLLRSQRPTYTDPPPPPELLREWLGHEWSNCRETPQPIATRNIRAADGTTLLTIFKENPKNVTALASYRAIWDEWAANERISYKAGEIFEKLYALHGLLNREGERYEIIIADGILVWGRSDGGIRHPLLFRTVRLEFSPEIPEFRIVEMGNPTEFYSSLFRSMQDVDGQTIGRLRSEVETMDPHPLGLSETDGFLRSAVVTLSSHGEYLGDAVPAAEREHPIAGRGACFILRRRTSGLASAIEAIIENTTSGGELPRALCNVVGRPNENKNQQNGVKNFHCKFQCK